MRLDKPLTTIFPSDSLTFHSIAYCLDAIYDITQYVSSLPEVWLREDNFSDWNNALLQGIIHRTHRLLEGNIAVGTAWKTLMLSIKSSSSHLVLKYSRGVNSVLRYGTRRSIEFTERDFSRESSVLPFALEAWGTRNQLYFTDHEATKSHLVSWYGRKFRIADLYVYSFIHVSGGWFRGVVVYSSL